MSPPQPKWCKNLTNPQRLIHQKPRQFRRWWEHSCTINMQSTQTWWSPSTAPKLNRPKSPWQHGKGGATSEIFSHTSRVNSIIIHQWHGITHAHRYILYFSASIQNQIRGLPLPKLAIVRPECLPPKINLPSMTPYICNAPWWRTCWQSTLKQNLGRCF